MNARLGLNVVSFQTAGNKPKCWSGSFPSPPAAASTAIRADGAARGRAPRDESQLQTVN